MFGVGIWKIMKTILFIKLQSKHIQIKIRSNRKTLTNIHKKRNDRLADTVVFIEKKKYDSEQIKCMMLPFIATISVYCCCSSIHFVVFNGFTSRKSIKCIQKLHLSPFLINRMFWISLQTIAVVHVSIK